MSSYKLITLYAKIYAKNGTQYMYSYIAHDSVCKYVAIHKFTTLYVIMAHIDIVTYKLSTLLS